MSAPPGKQAVNSEHSPNDAKGEGIDAHILGITGRGGEAISTGCGASVAAAGRGRECFFMQRKNRHNPWRGHMLT